MEAALFELGTCVEEVAAERAAIEADSKEAAEDVSGDLKGHHGQPLDGNAGQPLRL